MERLIDFLTKQKNKSIRQRWLSDVFLPMIVVFLLGIGGIALYVCLGTARSGGHIVLFVAAIALVVTAVVWFLTNRFLKSVLEPLRHLSELAGRISEGNYGSRAEKLRDDELGALTDSINEMSVEIARSETLQTEFISSVSHELRTPLTAITGWAETLAYDEAITGDSRRGVEIITKEASRLTKMVGELLEFTRIHDGRFKLNMETVNIAAEVEDAIYTYSSLLMQENVALNYACEEADIPPIEGDAERLKQVFLNLIDNAAKYGRNGESIEVSVKTDKQFVIITTRDHGPGIPEEELPHVKEKFYKGSGKERGSGIGLAVCEEIVMRHGGKLLIENAKDGGVLATVMLPLKNEDFLERDASHGRKKERM